VDFATKYNKKVGVGLNNHINATYFAGQPMISRNEIYFVMLICTGKPARIANAFSTTSGCTCLSRKTDSIF
jgi:hypothetical protein